MSENLSKKLAGMKFEMSGITDFEVTLVENTVPNYLQFYAEATEEIESYRESVFTVMWAASGDAVLVLGFASPAADATMVAILNYATYPSDDDAVFDYIESYIKDTLALFAEGRIYP